MEKSETKNGKKVSKTRFIAATGILSALSALLYLYVKLPLPFLFPSFLELHVSEIPALIGGFAYGPWCGVIIIIVRYLIKIISYSNSAYVGEFGDLIIGLILVLSTSLLYKRKKTFKNALLSFVFGVILSTIAAIFINEFILIPYFLKLAKMPMSELIDACSAIKGINENNFMSMYLLLGVVPFNLVRFVIVGVFTFLLYKKIHKLLDKIK